MSSSNNSKTVVFSNDPHCGIPQLVEAALNAVKELVPSVADRKTLLYKIKWAITELIINGLKHAGTTSTLFITVHGNQLTVEKTDSGNLFSLPINNGTAHITWPLANHHTESTVFIYPDPGSYLYATISPDGMARFWITEEEQAGNTVHDDATIHEHFGLLIITKSTDEFFYQYDKEKRLNVFTCRFFI